LFLSLVVAQAQTNAPAPGKDTKTEQEVKAAQLAVKEAAKAKDRAAYERLIADGFTFIHSNRRDRNPNFTTRTSESMRSAPVGRLVLRETAKH
jgi:hypothetical protein